MSCHHTSEVNVYKYGNITVFTEGNDSIWEGLKSKFLKKNVVWHEWLQVTQYTIAKRIW